LDSAKLHDWIQIIGIFALVASLIFVGFQIKQTQEIAEAEAYQARAATSVELSAMAASSPEFTSGMAKLYAGNVDELTAQEKVSTEYFFGAEMTVYENHHFQFEAGYLPKEHWDRNVSGLRCLLTLPYVREVIANWEWRESFQQVIDEIMASALSNPSDCWQ
jgi:hypothetical protein